MTSHVIVILVTRAVSCVVLLAVVVLVLLLFTCFMFIFVRC